MNPKRLVQEAQKAQKSAYAPYSQFKVGAALLTKEGKLFVGSNIENSSFSLTCCAERVAIFKAVSEGNVTFSKLAIIANSEGPISPCGACRQVMAEFFDDDVNIYLTNLKGELRVTSISQLLPNSFMLKK